MKYCTKCGAEIEENVKFCPKCGSALDKQMTEGVQNAPSVHEDSSLMEVAKIFMVISTVIGGLCIIPLAWLLPMTLKLYRESKEGRKTSTAFNVCTLLFANTISGILLLIDAGSNNK